MTFPVFCCIAWFQRISNQYNEFIKHSVLTKIKTRKKQFQVFFSFKIFLKKTVHDIKIELIFF